MIVRDRPSAWRLFFIMRGSIVPKVAPQILATMILATVVSALHGTVFHHSLTFTATPFTILGLALSIFLGFRNSAAYDRYWEGRKLWGELLITSRVLARQAHTLVAPRADDAATAAVRRRFVHRVIAFAHALRHHLRGTRPDEDLAPLLDPASLRAVTAARQPAQAVLRLLGQDLRGWLARGELGDATATNLDDGLATLDRVLGGCERIRSTPIPFSYTLLLHRTAYLYCFLLPFGLVDTVGMATPIVVGLVSYTFFGLDALGDEIEEPFGTLPNDLPLAALGRVIEIDLRDALGESPLPAPLAPRGYLLD